MPQILNNTGVKLWSKDDYSELWLSVFEELTGTAGKSNIRLIDEAIGNINASLDGYYFLYENNRLYICKDNENSTEKFPLQLVSSDGKIVSSVDGTTITIDENGVLHGTTVDNAFSLTSANPVQNKVVKEKIDDMDKEIAQNATDVKSLETVISSHISDSNNPHHISKTHIGLANVEDKSSETIRNEITKDNVTTALGYTPYTPNEIDNKFSSVETNISWKESVGTFNDIATIYPNPSDGWTVNVNDTDYTYRYDGSEWIAISANSIPKATNNVDGLLSKEDHSSYDDAVSKAHAHDNKSVLDGITNNKISDWDSINNKVDKVNGKGLSTNDYTNADKTKLDGIASGANKTVVDSALSETSENPVQNKVINTEINNLKKSVSDGKTSVANAITAKGVTTATDATFATMAANIEAIETGSSMSLNVFTQENEPETKEGVWIQTLHPYQSVEVGNKIYSNNSVKIDGWKKSVNLPLKTYRYSSVVVYNDEIHILGGNSSSSYNRHYKLSGNTWEELGTLPYGFMSGDSVVFNGEIHIFGGYYGSDDSTRKNHYKLNGNTWEEVSTLPYNFSGCAIVYKDEIHLISAQNHYKFNGNIWEKVSTLPETWNYYQSASIVVYNDEIHAFICDSTSTNYKQYHDVFNGSTWESEIITLPWKIYDASAVVYNDEIHLLGGYYKNYTPNGKNHYKLNGNTWEEVSTLPYNFYCGYAVVCNNLIHILSGNEEDNAISHYVTYSNPPDTTGAKVSIYQNSSHTVGDYTTSFISGVNVTDATQNKKFPFGFDDVFYVSSSDSVEEAPTYYGDGTQWIKFKN